MDLLRSRRPRGGDPAPGATCDLLVCQRSIPCPRRLQPEITDLRQGVDLDPDITVDGEFFRHRLETAIRMRNRWSPGTGRDACRLVHAESDGLPGLIIDRYADVIVLQSLTTGSEYWKDTFADLLMELSNPSSLLERSDAEVRELEGLPPLAGLLRGKELQKPLIIQENDLKFKVDPIKGHKTGFYLDQRLNRQYVRNLASGRQVSGLLLLYRGIHAECTGRGCHISVAVDASGEALDLCRENIALNDLPSDRTTCLQGDVFQVFANSGMKPAALT